MLRIRTQPVQSLCAAHSAVKTAYTHTSATYTLGFCLNSLIFKDTYYVYLNTQST